MALYIPHSIFHLARLLCVRPETFGPCYVRHANIFHYLGDGLQITRTLFIAIFQAFAAVWWWSSLIREAE